MSVVQNKYLPMLESRRYAARRSQGLSSSCTIDLWAIPKPIMDIFLHILDENWLDDT